uniref:Tetratricopeptide repeat protein 1 n=1 Tax=Ditylum brightwellii TaxID=49249 RepID=A0A7S4RC79_9STRA|mmetsp:Transcript_27509/g.36530  ORF Transcript_27509/g.36530 Transcript_27509/m.36530 type:complete len:310 (+) Transcript_27509:71-1000(+)
MASTTFTSEGFDLDAIPDSTNNADVIYEVGGGATVVPTPNKPKIETKTTEAEDAATAKSEELKGKGNEEFKAGNYLDAYDYYTDAIEACPGMTGEELMTMKEEFEEQQREKAHARHMLEQEKRRKRSFAERQSRAAGESSTTNAEEEEEEEEETEEEQQQPATFQPPPHEHAKQLSVYHCNRAACLLHLQERNDEAINDCTIALLLNPTYVKALIRRMTAYENIDDTESALKDAQAALMIDPKNTNARKNVTRLEKLEKERMEKLKDETIGKLKDLGNSILGNFGLSLDNFNAVKDPNTGSYSISFDNK